MNCFDFVYGGFLPQSNYLFLRETMWTWRNSHWRLPDSYRHSKSNVLRISFFSEETANVLASIEFVGFMMNVKQDNIKLWKTFTDYFNCLPIAASQMRKYFVMEVYQQIFSLWSIFTELRDQLMYRVKLFFVIFHILTLIKMS